MAPRLRVVMYSNCACSSFSCPWCRVHEDTKEDTRVWLEFLFSYPSVRQNAETKRGTFMLKTDLVVAALDHTINWLSQLTEPKDHAHFCFGYDYSMKCLFKTLLKSQSNNEQEPPVSHNTLPKV